MLWRLKDLTCELLRRETSSSKKLATKAHLLKKERTLKNTHKHKNKCIIK